MTAKFVFTTHIDQKEVGTLCVLFSKFREEEGIEVLYNRDKMSESFYKFKVLGCPDMKDFVDRFDPAMTQQQRSQETANMLRLLSEVTEFGAVPGNIKSLVADDHRSQRVLVSLLGAYGLSAGGFNFAAKVILGLECKGEPKWKLGDKDIVKCQSMMILKRDVKIKDLECEGDQLLTQYNSKNAKVLSLKVDNVDKSVLQEDVGFHQGQTNECKKRIVMLTWMGGFSACLLVASTVTAALHWVAQGPSRFQDDDLSGVGVLSSDDASAGTQANLPSLLVGSCLMGNVLMAGVWAAAWIGGYKFDETLKADLETHQKEASGRRQKELAEVAQPTPAKTKKNE